MTETNIPGSPLVIPGPDSPCELWRTYFTRLKREVGRENAKTFLRENEAVALEIEDKIRAAHGLDFDMPEGEKSDDDAILEA